MSTETIIQNRFYYDFFQAFHVILPNVSIDHGSEMDLFCIRNSGYCEEFEIKLSVSDFKADFKKTCTTNEKEKNGHNYYDYVEKPKHELLQAGKLKANRFNFIVPESLVEKIEIPDYAGLFIYRAQNNGGFDHVYKKKQGKLLHRNKVDMHTYKQCCNKYQHRFWRLRNNE